MFLEAGGNDTNHLERSTKLLAESLEDVTHEQWTKQHENQDE